MKLFLASIILTAAVTCSAQTVANTSNVLHPLTKNGHGRKGISSLDSDPALSGEYANPGPSRYRGMATAGGSTRPVPASAIVAKVDPDLNPSKISLVGTVNGLRGKLSVSNTSGKTITPVLQLAVCDEKGFEIGFALKNCAAIGPSKTAQIEVLATNLGAVDLKIVRLLPLRRFALSAPLPKVGTK